jgi:hypothetical protein
VGKETAQKAPAAPDTSAISNAQAAAAAAHTTNANDQLKWAKDQATKNQGTTDQVVGSALDTQHKLHNSASADRSAYENSAYPALTNEINDAKTYASAGKKDLDIGAAQATVGQQFDAARNNSTQALESYGVNPSSTRFAALDIGTRANEAAAKAAAGTKASNDVDATARALNHQVLTDSMPLANQSLAESNAAGAAGTGAVNNAAANTASGAATMGTGAQWSGLANQSLAGQASTVNQGYQNQLEATKINNEAIKTNNSSSSGLGTLAGLAMTAGKAYMTGGTSLFGDAAGAITTGGPGGPTPFYAEGGAVDAGDATQGGAVPVHASPTGGKAVDDVSAKLNVGEFIIPKDVAAWKGQEHFQKLIDQSRKASAAATAKPTVGPAIGGPTTLRSSPQQGAIPMARAA